MSKNKSSVFIIYIIKHVFLISRINIMPQADCQFGLCKFSIRNTEVSIPLNELNFSKNKKDKNRDRTNIFEILNNSKKPCSDQWGSAVIKLFKAVYTSLYGQAHQYWSLHACVGITGCFNVRKWMWYQKQ